MPLSRTDRVYLLATIQPGKEQEFANEVISKGLAFSSKVERMDFVHGSVDFIIIFVGDRDEIDIRILDIRKLSYVRNTQTLIPFDMLRWEDVSASMKQKP